MHMRSLRFLSLFSGCMAPHPSSRENSLEDSLPQNIVMLREEVNSPIERVPQNLSGAESPSDVTSDAPCIETVSGTEIEGPQKLELFNIFLASQRLIEHRSDLAVDYVEFLFRAHPPIKLDVTYQFIVINVIGHWVLMFSINLPEQNTMHYFMIDSLHADPVKGPLVKQSIQYEVFTRKISEYLKENRMMPIFHFINVGHQEDNQMCGYWVLLYMERLYEALKNDELLSLLTYLSQFNPTSSVSTADGNNQDEQQAKIQKVIKNILFKEEIDGDNVLAHFAFINKQVNRYLELPEEAEIKEEVERAIDHSADTQVSGSSFRL